MFHVFCLLLLAVSSSVPALSAAETAENQPAVPASAVTASPAVPAQSGSASGDASDVKPSKKTPINVDPSGEWEFLKARSMDTREEATETVLVQLSGLIRKNSDADFAPDALFLRSSLQLRLGDYKAAVVDILHIIYEYPDSKVELQAKRSLMDIIDKKMSSKIKPVLAEIAKGPGTEDKSERLAVLLKKITTQAADILYPAVLREYEGFFGRFPAFSGQDELLVSLGDLHVKNARYLSALLAYEKLLALYPESCVCIRARAQRSIGDIYASNLKDPTKAVDAYQKVTTDYPSSAEAGTAYIQIAKLEEGQKQYDLALDVYEKMIKLSAGKDAALAAFKAEARLLKDVMSKPADAIKVYTRLADMFKGSADAAEALKTAGETAYKLKDFVQAVELYQRIAAECPDNAIAPEMLYAAGQVSEEDIANLDKAVEIYGQLAIKYPAHKLAKKAQGRVTAITKKK